MSQFAPASSSGGHVLAWRPGVKLECFISNKHNISTWCYSDPPNSSWILSCIYGHSDKRDKLAVWDSFTYVGEGFVRTWLCIRDLNYVLDQSEKLGDRHVTSSSHCPFKHFIGHFGLMDLGFVGNP
jgi:hypothetical protein